MLVLANNVRNGLFFSLIVSFESCYLAAVSGSGHQADSQLGKHKLFREFGLRKGVNPHLRSLSFGTLDASQQSRRLVSGWHCNRGVQVAVGPGISCQLQLCMYLGQRQWVYGWTAFITLKDLLRPTQAGDYLSAVAFFLDCFLAGSSYLLGIG